MCFFSRYDRRNCLWWDLSYCLQGACSVKENWSALLSSSPQLTGIHVCKHLERAGRSDYEIHCRARILEAVGSESSEESQLDSCEAS